MDTDARYPHPHTGGTVMTFETSTGGHAKRVAKLIAATQTGSTGVLTGIWHWIDGVAKGVSNFIGGPVLALGKAILHHLENIKQALVEYLSVLQKIVFWVDRLIWHTVKGWVTKLQAHTKAELRALRKYLVGLIFITTQTVLSTAMHAVRRERHDRGVAVGRAERQARSLVRAMHHTIEREASSGYAVDRSDRTSTVVKLLEFAALRNPELRVIVGDVAKGLVALLEVDDPLLRIAITFFLKQIIDRLGIDKALGGLISDLTGPLLERNDPRNIHDVVMDLSARLDADEKQWAKFFADGGAQIEEAGSSWRDITSIAGMAAVLGFTVQAVIAPDLWAKEIQGTIGVAASEIAATASKLFKG